MRMRGPGLLALSALAASAGAQSPGEATPFGLPAVARLVGIGQAFAIVEVSTLAGASLDATFHVTATGVP